MDIIHVIYVWLQKAVQIDVVSLLHSPGKPRAAMKSGRVNWRQCNTSDTVGSDTGKPGGQFPEDKNKYNQSFIT